MPAVRIQSATCLTPDQVRRIGINSNRAYWWLKNGSTFYTVPRVRGDQFFDAVVDLAPGNYVLGVGSTIRIPHVVNGGVQANGRIDGPCPVTAPLATPAPATVVTPDPATVEKTADCNVTHGCDWVEILNVGTGNTLRLSIRTTNNELLADGFRAFTGEDRMLLDLLIGDPTADSHIVLTASQLQRFVKMVEKADRWCGRTAPLPLAGANGVHVVNAPPALPAAPSLVDDSTAKVHNQHAARVNRQVIHTDDQADAAEQRIRGLQSVVNSMDDEFYFVQYDIETEKEKHCPNPSHIFWHLGFRMTKSVWCFRKKSLTRDIAQRVFARWREYGIEFSVLPFSEKAMGDIRAMARRNLSREIVKVHTALITNIDKASQTMADATAGEITANEADEAQKAYVGKLRGYLRTAGIALEYSIKCAELFDETDNVSDLLAGLRAAIRSQAAAFNAYVAPRGLKTVAAV